MSSMLSCFTTPKVSYYARLSPSSSDKDISTNPRRAIHLIRLQLRRNMAKGNRNRDINATTAISKTVATNKAQGKSKPSFATSDTNAVSGSYSALPDLRRDASMWYRIRVLVYDLKNIRDTVCEKRTLQTVDPLYISAPYFSPEEADQIKACTVTETEGTTTIEQAITQKLENFLEKRRASGDSRPCGPHDLVPVYIEVFGIEKAEIEDEKFVSRIRRSGLAS